MMKAALINGATDMGYGYMGRDQGWGRINILDSLNSREYQYVDQERSLSTGQTANYIYSIESNKTPFKISLVWTDYPGSTSASKALVNDLDIKVTSPSGTVYYGNDFSQPFDSNFDRLNNVENVFITNPETGNYTVEVIAYNVPQGPQPFTLFASADFKSQGSDTESPACSITSPANGATVNGNVTISASASDNVGVTKVLFFADGQSLGEDSSAPYEFQWDTAAVSNGQHKLLTKAYDAAGNIGTSSEITVNVDNQTKDTEAPACSITSPANGATVNGNVTISASASDNVGVTKVLFFADGQSLGEDSSAPYEFQWDTAAVSNGQHKLLTKAYDAAGNMGTSSEITVNVDNQTGIKYVTENYSGTAYSWSSYQKTIDVTAVGKITINLSGSSGLSMKLYNPSGTAVASGTSSISYDAKSTGKYKIVVASSKFFGSSFNLKVTYPVAENGSTDKIGRAHV